MKKRWICLAAAPLLLLMPARFVNLQAQAGSCGAFADVSPTNQFCGTILQAFYSGITNGTSNTTFDPTALVAREQMVAFFTRTMDQTLRRGSVRTAINKTWAPLSGNNVIPKEIGGAVNDVASDGTNLWVARNDNRILKVSPSDRRILETWTTDAPPVRIGVFAGSVWAVSGTGRVYFFDPSGTPGAAFNLITFAVSGFPSLAYDGTNLWVAGSSTSAIGRYAISAPNGSVVNAGANVNSLVFDGTFMWVLLADGRLQKRLPTGDVVETVNIPGGVSDCRMGFDGKNIWIPTGGGTLHVVRPTTTAQASSVILSETVPAVGFPYVASFDGENVVIGGVNNGNIAVYQATTLKRLGTFNSGAAGVRGIASNGISFTVGDAFGTKLFQF